MGTRFDALIIGKNRLESHEIWNAIVSELQRLDRIFNRFDERSEVSMINRNAGDEKVLTSSEMWAILQNCKEYHVCTFGLFDITLNDFTMVSLDERARSVTFLKKDISLDFGGYAKGYALTKLKDIIQEARIQHCFIDFGNSSIFGMGCHPYGDSWKVSVQDPYSPNAILDEFSLQDQALSVSGNTPTYNGHILRPDTREVQYKRKAVTIISDDPLTAEVLSTVYMIADEIEKEQIKKHFNIQHIAEYSI